MGDAAHGLAGALVTAYPTCCGISFVRGRPEGLQQTGELPLELVTCRSCGSTLSRELSPLAPVRIDQCRRVIADLASRDDLDAVEFVRRAAMVLAEIRSAQAGKVAA